VTKREASKRDTSACAPLWPASSRQGTSPALWRDPTVLRYRATTRSTGRADGRIAQPPPPRAIAVTVVNRSHERRIASLPRLGY